MIVAYILDYFPKISSTFILNEILAVQERGVDVRVFAFDRAREDKIHPHVNDVKHVAYFPKNTFRQVLAAHVCWLWGHPLRYGRTFFLALKGENGLRDLFFRRLPYVSLVKGEKPDHIHAHFGNRAANMAMLIYLLTGREFTFTTHRYDIFDRPPANYKMKSRLAKKHLTVSEFNKRYLAAHFDIPIDQMEVVHCGVNFSRPAPVRKPEAAQPENAILSVARLEKEKGLDCLIRACALLKKRGMSFSCSIVGEGGERGRLESLIQELKMSKEVVLLGNQTQDEVFGLLRRSTIFVLPSRSEGIPVSLMEAMSLNIPVVSTRITGIPELIENGVSGFLVQPDDAESLAARMRELMVEPEIRETLARHAFRKVFNDFNLEKEAGKLISLWLSSNRSR